MRGRVWEGEWNGEKERIVRNKDAPEQERGREKTEVLDF